MAEHRAAIEIDAPVHQVYELYTHFNDYPKFMTFVKEVTYLDDRRSHWVVDVAGRHAWDAVNENWIADRRIGWRSVDGLRNSGEVLFEALTPERTRLSLVLTYEPPAGVLGALVDTLGVGGAFDLRLQHDLDHFAQMVAQAPSGALDPTSSSYLFHADSAAGRGDATVAQNESMGGTSEAFRDDALNDPTLPRVPGTSATSAPPA